MLNKKSIKLALLSSVFGLALNASSVMAWWESGHQSTAMIAEKHINDHTRKKITEILGNGIYLDEISVCPDQVKFNPVKCANSFELKKMKETSSWHYIDIPLNSIPTRESLQEHCKNDDCVVNQIENEIRDLKDPKKTKFEKKVALMFLVHFVADIHEPLHCVDDDDKGGNDKKVKINWEERERSAKKMNLHSVWDNLIQDDLPDHNYKPEYLFSTLEKDLAKKDTTDWLKGDVKDWTIESFYIAKNVIYKEYKVNNGNLDEKYVAKMQPIAKELIEKGGLRLAKVLDDTFASVK